MIDKNYCPLCDAFLPSEPHKPMCELMRRLEALTPTGSEYVGDPLACLDYIEKKIDSLSTIKVDTYRKANAYDRLPMEKRMTVND